MFSKMLANRRKNKNCGKDRGFAMMQPPCLYQCFIKVFRHVEKWSKQLF